MDCYSQSASMFWFCNAWWMVTDLWGRQVLEWLISPSGKLSPHIQPPCSSVPLSKPHPPCWPGGFFGSGIGPMLISMYQAFFSRSGFLFIVQPDWGALLHASCCLAISTCCLLPAQLPQGGPHWHDQGLSSIDRSAHWTIDKNCIKLIWDAAMQIKNNIYAL